jgi:hypothetical protein
LIFPASILSFSPDIMRAFRRELTLPTAACYLLVISTSALFHDHHRHGDGEGKARDGVSASHHADEGACAVCRFEAQKPAPTTEVSLADCGVLVRPVATRADICAEGDVFSAWHSRGPPAIA